MGVNVFLRERVYGNVSGNVYGRVSGTRLWA